MTDDRLQRAVDFGGDGEGEIGHHFHRPMLADGHVDALRRPRDGEDLRDGAARRHAPA